MQNDRKERERWHGMRKRSKETVSDRNSVALLVSLWRLDIASAVTSVQSRTHLLQEGQSPRHCALVTWSLSSAWNLPETRLSSDSAPFCSILFCSRPNISFLLFVFHLINILKHTFDTSISIIFDRKTLSPWLINDNFLDTRLNSKNTIKNPRAFSTISSKIKTSIVKRVTRSRQRVARLGTKETKLSRKGGKKNTIITRCSARCKYWKGKSGIKQ